jgi:hypothetical protein
MYWRKIHLASEGYIQHLKGKSLVLQQITGAPDTESLVLIRIGIMGRRGAKHNYPKAPGRAARGQGGHAASAVEEEDLSEDLLDYLQNVAQVSILFEYNMQCIQITPLRPCC